MNVYVFSRGGFLVYTLTYSNIHESEKDIIGNRALSLAMAKNNNVNSCIFFVVTKDAFDEFYKFNSLSEKISNLLNVDCSEDDFWFALKNLFSECVFPDSVKDEIRESYDALSVSNEVDNILRSFESRVNVFSSEGKRLSDVFLNIKGVDNVLSAIKSSWFYFLKLNGVDFVKSGIGCGVVVEKFISADFSVEAELSSDDKNIILHVYKGLPEVSEGLVKDVYVLSVKHLEFINYELNNQNFSIIHQEDSGVLLKKRLGREGSDNKASKFLVSECARLFKKVLSLFDSSVKCVFVVKKDVPYLFLVDFFESVEKEEVSETETSFVDHSEELVKEDLQMPQNDEAGFSDSNFEKKNFDDLKSSEGDVSDEDLFVDSDEFIVQDNPEVDVSDDDVFSSFFKLVDLLEEDLSKSYKDSFGFTPSNFEEAIYELDSKHGFVDKDKILRVFEVKNLIVGGEEVDEDIISSLSGVIEDFLKRAN